MIARYLKIPSEKYSFLGFPSERKNVLSSERKIRIVPNSLPRTYPFVPTVPTCAVRETASLGIMGAPRVPPLNPSESIDAVSRTANVERTGRHKWVKPETYI